MSIFVFKSDFLKSWLQTIFFVSDTDYASQKLTCTHTVFGKYLPVIWCFVGVFFGQVQFFEIKTFEHLLLVSEKITTVHIFALHRLVAALVLVSRISHIR